jgi:hypothetical protein
MRIVFGISIIFIGICYHPAPEAALPLPIIDMHLHASAADNKGPPPTGMCAGARLSGARSRHALAARVSCLGGESTLRRSDLGAGNRPGAIEAGIEAIESADFLSFDQKRDILYNNAARFLRLSDGEGYGDSDIRHQTSDIRLGI